MRNPTSSIAYQDPDSFREQSHRKKRSIWLVLALFAIVTLLTVTFVSLWNYFDISLPTSPPNASLTADSLSEQSSGLPVGAIAWEFGAGEPITVPPIIVGGRVYVVSGRSIQTGKLSSLHLETGEVAWTNPLHSIADYPVTVADDFLYIGTRGGILYALNRHTGDEVWTFDTGESILGQPLVENGVLYVASGRVYALDAASGEQRWSHKLEGNASRPVAYSQGVVAAVGSNGDLSLIDAKHGKRRLTFSLWFGPSAGPVISGETAAIAGSGGNVQALALYERDVPMEKAVRYWWTKLWLWQMSPRPPLPIGFLWQRRGVGDVSAHPLAVDAERIYLATVDNVNRGRILALDQGTGETLWEFASESLLADKATLSGDVLMVGNEGGILYGLDTISGEKIWQIDVGSPLGTAPAVSNKHILAPTLDGTLIAFQ